MAALAELSGHEVATGAIGLVVFVVGLFVGLLTWVGKEKADKLAQVEKKQHEQSEQLAVLKADNLAKVVENQGERLAKLEEKLGDIRGDVKHIRALLDDERRP